MPLILTKAPQGDLLDRAKALTFSTGWMRDAVAFGALRNREDPPVAVAVYQSFGGGEAELHLGIEVAHLTRSVIEAFRTIAFHPQMLGLERLWTYIAADNPRALRAAIGSGFEVEFRKRGGYAGGKDAIVLSMTRPDADRSLPDQP